MPRGRKEIRIGPWGPLDPRLPHVFPQTIHAAGRIAVIHVSGRGTYSIDGLSGRVVVEPAAGTLPARLTIRPQAPDAGESSPALLPFAFDVQLGLGTQRVTGSLLHANWDVRFFEWSENPRASPARFLTTEPVVRQRLPALVFRWREGGPEGVRKDRFATVAETSVHLPEGRYRIRTISDDGIRVYVDGKRVTDNWTHHAPTEDKAEVLLSAGEHKIRVEHFELDGHAHLELVLSACP